MEKGIVQILMIQCGGSECRKTRCHVKINVSSQRQSDFASAKTLG